MSMNGAYLVDEKQLVHGNTTKNMIPPLPTTIHFL